MAHIQSIESLARAVHVTLAALGLGALLSTVPWAFEAVRWVGAVYLIWLGIRIAQAPVLAQALPRALAHMPMRAYRTAAWRGLLTNISNPKALLFCSVLLPQFIQAGTGHVAQQFLLLGLVLVITGLCFDLLYALSGTLLGGWMLRHPWAQSAQKWTFAALLVGFGVRLALTQRPQ